MKQELLRKIEARTLVAGVIGLGYVGLPSSRTDSLMAYVV